MIVRDADMTEGSSNDARPTATIHVDLDGASDIFAAHGWSYRDERDLLFESGLSNTLDLLDNVRLKATLFVIANDLEDATKRELIQDAVNRGHNIASHSLTHRKLTTLDLESKRREVFESRERLIEVLGCPVCGFRAPSFAIDNEVLELVAAAGYTYDSSILPNSQYLRKVGLINASPSPYYPLGGCPLIELPLPSYSPLPLPFHPSYSLVLGMWYFRLGLHKFRRLRVPLILLLHLTDLADPLPDHQLPNWKAKLFTLSHLSQERKRRRFEEMLDLVKREYELIDTTRLITNWRDDYNDDRV